MPSFLAGAGRGAQQSLQNMLARRRQEFLEERQFAVEEAERKRQREREKRLDSETLAARQLQRQTLYGEPDPVTGKIEITPEQEKVYIEGGLGDVVEKVTSIRTIPGVSGALTLAPLQQQTETDIRLAVQEGATPEVLGRSRINPYTKEDIEFPEGATPEDIEKYMDVIRKEGAPTDLALTKAPKRQRLMPIAQQEVALQPEFHKRYLKRSRADLEKEATDQAAKEFKRSRAAYFEAETPEDASAALRRLLKTNAPTSEVKSIVELQREVFAKPGLRVADVLPEYAGTVKGDMLVNLKADGLPDLGLIIQMERLKNEQQGTAQNARTARNQLKLQWRTSWQRENSEALSSARSLGRMQRALGTLQRGVDGGDLSIGQLLQIGDKTGESGKYNAAAQAILVTFQKILDPTSVVRESEFLRSEAGLSFLSRMRGAIEGIFLGGAGVPVSELVSFVEMAETFFIEQQEALDFSARQYRAMSFDEGMRPDDWKFIVGDQDTIRRIQDLDPLMPGDSYDSVYGGGTLTKDRAYEILAVAEGMLTESGRVVQQRVVGSSSSPYDMRNHQASYFADEGYFIKYED